MEVTALTSTVNYRLSPSGDVPVQGNAMLAASTSQGSLTADHLQRALSAYDQPDNKPYDLLQIQGIEGMASATAPPISPLTLTIPLSEAGEALPDSPIQPEITTLFFPVIFK